MEKGYAQYNDVLDQLEFINTGEHIYNYVIHETKNGV